MKITGIVSGGLMGSEPFHSSTWSGSSAGLFTQLQNMDVLEQAYGASISKVEYALRLLPLFYPNKDVWQRRLMMQSSYRNALTNSLHQYASHTKSSHILQLGAYCNARKVFGNKHKIFSYQDGNVVQKFESGTTHPAISKDNKLFKQVFDYEKQVAHDMDLVLTTSEYLRESFIDAYKLAPEKVVNVDIGINLQEYPEALTVEKNFDAPEFLFIGKSRFLVKGGDIAVETFANIQQHYPNAQLHMVGIDHLPSKYAGINGVNTYGVLNNRVERDNVILSSLFSKCCVSLQPSRFEPFGIAPIEAMLHKIVPIVTGEWALQYTVEDGITGRHAKKADVDDWTRTALALLQNPEHTKQMGIQGRKVAQQRFTWQKTAANIASLFEQY